jgi:SUF system NifU family Fe-S assembly protein
MGELGDLYQEVILEHSKAPRNFRRRRRRITKPRDINPLCGDRCTVYIDMDGARSNEIGFQGSGCAISRASASMMTQMVKGKTKEEAVKLFEQFHSLVTGEGRRQPMRRSRQDGRFRRRFQVPRARQVRHARLAHAAIRARRQAGNRLDRVARGTFRGSRSTMIQPIRAPHPLPDLPRGDDLEAVEDRARSRDSGQHRRSRPHLCGRGGAAEDGGKRIEVRMTLTAPGCSMSDVIKAEVERKLAALPEVREVKVEVVFDPPWNPG